ncbi:MAG: prolyl oligopeptidase family serine peptidase [Candidatus Polarisedimenticolia bacterium]
MKTTKLVLGLSLAALAAGCATGAAARRSGTAPVRTGILFESLRDSGRTYLYAVYVPRNYDPARAWPLVLFLHGSGESGADGAKPINQGIGPAILWNVEAWPAIVVFPQKPTVESEWEQHESAVTAIVARTIARYNVDKDRLYLTGASQGGHGAWVLGARHADLWAAVAPVCGYVAAHQTGEPGMPPPFNGRAAELAAPLARVPVWAFHGEADDVVPPQETREMAAALEAAGGKPRVSILPGVNHGAWDPAYRDGALRDWLFAQRRKR